MSTPEGWYPNPTNPEQEIRWDGERWTGETRPIVAAESTRPGEAGDADGAGGEATPTAPAKRKLPHWAWITIPAAAVVVIAAMLVVFLVAIPAANEANAKSVAVAMCKQKTLDQLKAPATAKFGPMKPIDFVTALNASAKEKGLDPIKPKPSKDGSRSYIITSYVDAENGFGALVRNDISCVIGVKGGKADKDSVALVTSKDE